MQFNEERKWQRNGVTNWTLELFEYLRSSRFSFDCLVLIDLKLGKFTHADAGQKCRIVVSTAAATV